MTTDFDRDKAAAAAVAVYEMDCAERDFDEATQRVREASDRVNWSNPDSTPEAVEAWHVATNERVAVWKAMRAS